ncbi:MAG: hypothetical protein ACRDJF_12990, partial [Actinomycetota bacterium]
MHGRQQFPERRLDELTEVDPHHREGPQKTSRAVRVCPALRHFVGGLEFPFLLRLERGELSEARPDLPRSVGSQPLRLQVGIWRFTRRPRSSSS